MAGEYEQEAPGDAERAFEDLRAEVTVMRRAVEEMPRALKAGLPPAPPDYRQDLGRMARELAAVEQRLAGIEAQPALATTAGSYAATIREAGRDAAAPAVQQLDRAVREAEKTGQELAAMIGHMRGKAEQRDWVILLAGLAGGVGLALGLLGSPFLAAHLPFGWNEQVAAIAMNTDRWDAGAELMRASNPTQWNRLADDWNLIDGSTVNAKAVTACEAAAVRTGKAEDCQVVVPAPHR